MSPWNAAPELVPTDGVRDGRSVLVSAYTKDATSLWLWSLERFSDRPEKIVFERPRTHIWQSVCGCFSTSTSSLGLHLQLGLRPVMMLRPAAWREPVLCGSCRAG